MTRQWPVPWRYGVLDMNEKNSGVRRWNPPKKNRAESRDLMRCFLGGEMVEIFFGGNSQTWTLDYVEFSGRSLMFPKKSGSTCLNKRSELEVWSSGLGGMSCPPWKVPTFLLGWTPGVPP